MKVMAVMRTVTSQSIFISRAEGGLDVSEPGLRGGSCVLDVGGMTLVGTVKSRTSIIAPSTRVSSS